MYNHILLCISISIHDSYPNFKFQKKTNKTNQLVDQLSACVLNVRIEKVRADIVKYQVDHKIRYWCGYQHAMNLGLV